MTRRSRLGPLAARLAAAFAAVAVLAVAVLATLIVVTAGRQTDALLTREHTDTARAAAATAARAYRAAGGWTGANLSAAATVAASTQASFVVSDNSGQLIAAPTDELASMMSAMHGVAPVETPRGHAVTAPVILDGNPVGSVTLTFPLAHDTPADQLRTALWRTAVAGTGLAAALALAVGLWVASRITRPVTALTVAATALAAGDSDARANAQGPGELGVLAATFDEMADRLQTEDRLRRQLISDIAHELRTPLTILQGETEALLDGVTTPTPATLGSLHDETVRLSRVVEDLEVLAAADAAGLTLHTGPVDLAEIAANAAATVRNTATQAGVTLHEALEPAPIIGDPNRLHQVALNLLSNAIKFTPTGGTVIITTASRNGEARLTVDDTGMGLAPGEQDHVFDRFWQGQAGKAAATGSGIGLAVAQGIASAHHGILTASNHSDGPGSTFELRLPCSRA